MYDFANSGYTTVVITALFNAYFVAEVAGNAPWGTLAWTGTLAVSYAAIMVAGPLVGAYADARGAKKRVLAATTCGCVVFTAALALVGRGEIGLGVACVVLSNFFFGLGENLIAAFLPELADEDAIGRISGWGWSLGYLGGLVSLGICLVYVARAQAAGEPATEFVPVAMLITAGLFALASLPTFLFLRERAAPQALLTHVVKDTVARLAETLRHVRDHRDLARFLVCVVFYQAGVQAVIALAAIYAQEAMRFTMTETLSLILIVNVTAAVGAFLFGHFQDRLGHVRTIVLTLVGWIVVVVLAWAAREPARVLVEREPRRPVSRLESVRRTRDGRLPESAFPHRRVLRSVGTRGQALGNRRSDHLRRRHMADRWRSPPRDPRDGRLFRHRSWNPCDDRRGARTACSDGRQRDVRNDQGKPSVRRRVARLRPEYGTVRIGAQAASPRSWNAKRHGAPRALGETSRPWIYCRARTGRLSPLPQVRAYRGRGEFGTPGGTWGAKTQVHANGRTCPAAPRRPRLRVRPLHSQTHSCNVCARSSVR